MVNHSAVYWVAGDSYDDLGQLRSGGIIDAHYIVHGGGSSPPSNVVNDILAAKLSPVLNNGNDGQAGWNGLDSYNANLAAAGWHAVGGESEQAAEIDSIMSHLTFLDYGGEGTGGGTDDDIWNVTHPGPVGKYGAVSYMETYDSNTNLWGWNVMGPGMQHAKAHGVKEIGMCVGTWMMNHSSAQDYINIAQQMEANGITFAGIGVWGGYGSNMNDVFNQFRSWYQAWMDVWPATNITLKNRMTPTPPPPPPPATLKIVGDAALCSRDNKTIDVFAVKSDEALWHRQLGVTPLPAWESLGGICTSSPAAVSLTPGTIDTFVRGSDSAMWHKRYNGTAWSSWNSLGGGIEAGTSPMAIIMNSCIILSVIGTNDVIYFKTSSDGVNWSAWINESD